MYRHREDGQFTYGSGTYTSIGKNGYPNAPSSFTASPSGMVRTMDDSITPNFRKRIAQGEIIINAVSSLKTTITPDPKVSECIYTPSSNYSPGGGYIGDQITDTIAFYFGSLGHPAEALPDYSAYDLSLTVTDAWSKVASPDALAFVSALEARETLDFLRGGAQALFKKTDPIRKITDLWVSGKLSPREFRRRLGDAWLAYRYGAMPLVYDVQGYLKALSSSTAYQSQREYANARSIVPFSTTVGGPSGSNTLRSYSSTWEIEGQHEYRAGVIYSAFHDRLSASGVSLADVPPSAWEGARMSFVADWALNIGQYLQGWSAHAKVNCLGSWKSVTTTSKAVLVYSETAGKYVGSQQGPLYSSLSQDASGATRTYEFKRVVRTASDIYDMGLGPRLNLNTKRVADAFFLLSNALDTRIGGVKPVRGVGRTLLRL